MAIKNIVFDLGNVLVDFDPAAYLQSFGYDASTVTRLLETVFAAAWPAGDRGDYLTLAQMRDDLVNAYPEDADAIRQVLQPDCVKMHTLRTDVAAFLHTLKTRGYRIYLLSNLAKYSYDFVSQYAFFKDIDGGVFSYQERVCKPQARIYHILLERYALVPQETIFLDDNAANIAAANRCGMHGVLFTTLLCAAEELTKLLQE